MISRVILLFCWSLLEGSSRSETKIHYANNVARWGGGGWSIDLLINGSVALSRIYYAKWIMSTQLKNIWPLLQYSYRVVDYVATQQIHFIAFQLHCKLCTCKNKIFQIRRANSFLHRVYFNPRQCVVVFWLYRTSKCQSDWFWSTFAAFCWKRECNFCCNI